MSIFTSRPALRWLAPLAALGVIGGGALIATTATADQPLPPRTAEELLVDVQQAQVTDLSGTVVQTSDLGLPDLPGLTTRHGTSLTSLISGTHTLRLWLAGEDKAKLAVHGELGEYALIRNGNDVWAWSSDERKATHHTLEAGDEHTGHEHTPMTPQQAAEKVLAALDPTTDVQVNPAQTVANRAAYQLVLTPRDEATLIGQVTLAVDGQTKVPLRVQVFARDGAKVFESGFTEVEFTQPEDKYFAFTAPAGTTVEEVDGEGHGHAEKGDRERPATSAVGEGWSRVTTVQVDLAEMVDSTADPDDGLDVGRLLTSLPAAPAGCPSGRLLAGKVFTVVITDDGRLAGGAVAPSSVCEALAR